MSDRRAQIEARLAAATPWPWTATYEDADDWTSITGQGGPLDGGGWIVCPEVATCEGEHGADADLITHAPADLRWLLDALAEAEAERDALAAVLLPDTYLPPASPGEHMLRDMAVRLGLIEKERESNG